MGTFLSQNTTIGMFMLGFGVLFMSLGVMFFFDKGLIALGNFLFLGAFPFLIGFKRTVKFFNPIARPDHWKGIVSFFFGIFLVLYGWPVFGMILEVYGIVSMFKKFFPMAITFMRNIPFMNTILGAPGINKVVDRYDTQKEIGV